LRRAPDRAAEVLERPAIVARFGSRVAAALLADAPAACEALASRVAGVAKAQVQTALGRAVFGPGIGGVDGVRNFRQRPTLAKADHARAKPRSARPRPAF
jgi:hypothetical protein